MSPVGRCVEFTVNGEKCIVDSCFPRDMSLNTYLRSVLALPGTKFMCQEGGCGACVVMVRAKRPTTGKIEDFSVNSILVFFKNDDDIQSLCIYPQRDVSSFLITISSMNRENLGIFYVNQYGLEVANKIRQLECLKKRQSRQLTSLNFLKRCRQNNLIPCLVLVFSCHGWSITTIENVGNRMDGYSEVQKRIVALNATQCGYCTPAWVMAITSLLNKNLTMAELEKSFGGNTCRCTGYRPLLDAIKSFAIDASPQLCKKVRDIEDVFICEKTKKPCKEGCGTEQKTLEEGDWVLLNEEISPNTIDIHFGNNRHFYKVFKLSDIFYAINANRGFPYMLLHGNTAKGIIPVSEYPPIVIDISNVDVLKTYYFDQNLVLGANIPLEDCIGIFKNTAETKSEFNYLSGFAEHLLLVSHIHVRQIGTLAGNLMIKHQLHLYPSDIFILFESVGATVTIQNYLLEKSVTLTEFLNVDMTGWLITKIELPPSSSSHVFRSYKITPRHQNSIAIVNAAFHVKLINNTIQQASFVYGNIGSKFSHATETEKSVLGKNIFDNTVLQKTIKVLYTEIQPEVAPPKSDPSIRRKLAVGLFYKFILSIAPPSIIRPEFRSGGKLLERPISEGTQSFDTDSSLYPLNQPLPKLEAMIQSSGEANYVNDLPPIKNEVFAAFVLSTVYSGEVDKIDATNILKQEGVLALYTAKDIPGKNTFVKTGLIFIETDEELLADKNITYYGQPIAIIVAKSYELAKTMAKKVQVTYKNVSTNPPVLTIDAAKKDPSRIIASDFNITPTRKGTNITKVVKGVYSSGSQYHYYMEPLTSIVIPIDKGLEVYPSSQFVELEQAAIAVALDIKDSEVFVKNRRVGGAFGGKITRCARVSTACALVVKKLNLPCRFIMPLDTNMMVNGKRYPCQWEYEVGVDDNGVIQYLDANVIADSGNSINEDMMLFLSGNFTNCYDKSVFSLKCSRVLTDTPSNVNTRAPGTVEALGSIEHIMEHIAFEVKKDPTDVRLSNMRTDDNDIPELIETLKTKADYNKRAEDIKEYNKSNRWTKKGIQINVMNFGIIYLSSYATMVSIYRGDGSVTVTSGGVELGQGLNTKLAQVVAYKLKIPVEKVNVLPVHSFVSPQNIPTGGSITSACVSLAAIKACEQLNERLAPVKAANPDASWEEIVVKAVSSKIDITSRYTVTEDDLLPYNCFAVAISETMIDVLTGRFNIERVDILEDVGLSTNPNIDVGQIEGAYVQGIGYLTCENLIYDAQSGKLLTNSSLSYHVPLCSDIPIKTNIHLRKKAYNDKGVLGAKAVGEMGICLSNGVLHGLRYAIQNSREASGYDANKWIDIGIPYTTDSILTALDVKLEELVLN